MSKLCDVKNMYGQDLGITVTNAPVSVLKEQDKLPKNMLIISSPGDDKKNDLGYPSIFGTDYNGNYIQLTYAIQTMNGLYPNDNGYLQLNIDNKTIKEKDQELSVDTNNLTYCSFNNLGVAKVSKAVSSRTNSAYPIDTFITADKNGVLYLSDSFLDYMYKYIANKIYENVYPLIVNNLKGWIINRSMVKYYPTDRISILGIDEANGIVITQQYTLQYDSLSDTSEEVSIDINNNDYPIKEVIFTNNLTTVSDNIYSTKEIKMYRHSIDFTVVFYPNYNLQNKIFLDNQYIIKFQPQSFEGNQSLMFYFDQNNAFDKYSNEIFEPFKISSTTINLNELRYNKDFEFMFVNEYRFFEDVNYNLELLYITSDNENNTDDAITLIDQNINTLVDDNYNSIKVKLTNGGELYNLWKNKLITVNDTTGVISKLSDISSLYKYILKYTINGERTYTYENIFKVNYLLTNIYQYDNYISLSEGDSITIYSLRDSDNNNIISGGSLNTTTDKANVDIINTSLNEILIEPKKDNNGYTKNEGLEFIYKIFQSLFEANTLREQSSSTEDYKTKGILGDSADDEGNYNNEVGFLLVFKGDYNQPIFIENGGESNNQHEYTIYNAITNAANEYGEYVDNDGKPIIIHNDENISLPVHSQYHTMIYPNPDKVTTNDKVLQILSYIKLDSFMFQNSTNRTHSKKTKPLMHNFSIFNAQGPTCSIKFKLDYAKFFMQHIKIFGVNYGHWPNQFRPGAGDFIINPKEYMQEITPGSTYSNSRFYVGINKTLFDNVIDLNSISIEWSFLARKNAENSNDITAVNIVATKNNAIDPNNTPTGHNNLYEDENYYMFEINYINEWYTKENNQITFNKQMIDWDSYIQIKYKWQKQQTDEKNIFNYDLGFGFAANLSDPDIVNRR